MRTSRECVYGEHFPQTVALRIVHIVRSELNWPRCLNVLITEIGERDVIPTTGDGQGAAFIKNPGSGDTVHPHVPIR